VTTKVYGTSDDLIEMEGEILHDEIDCFGTDERSKGVLLVFSDGTLLEVKYGKNNDAIWEVKLHKAGTKFLRIDLCTDSEAKPYSDIAHFEDGIEWAYWTDDWAKCTRRKRA